MISNALGGNYLSKSSCGSDVILEVLGIWGYR